MLFNTILFFNFLIIFVFFVNLNNIKFNKIIINKVVLIIQMIGTPLHKSNARDLLAQAAGDDSSRGASRQPHTVVHCRNRVPQ